MGAHMTNVTRPVKDVFVRYHAKVVKYKTEFPYTEFKKPAIDLEYLTKMVYLISWCCWKQ